MIRIFIDSTVLFSACLPASGASRAILERGVQGEIGIVVSALVLSEVGGNLADKAPLALPAFGRLLAALPLEIVRPSKAEVLDAAAYTAFKDAPIVAAAKRAHVVSLASLDRRHLVDPPEVAARSGLQIVLPGDLLRRLRQGEGELGKG